MKKILVSNKSIPAEKIRSIPMRYDYFLQHSDFFDLVVCRDMGVKSDVYEDKVIRVKLPWHKLKYRFSKYYYKGYLAPIITAAQEGHVLVYVIEDFLFSLTLHQLLVKKGLRKKVTLAYNICGYSYFKSISESLQFYNSLDYMFFLGKSAYQFEKNRLPHFNPIVKVVPNGINERFCPSNEKIQLRKTFGVPEDAKVYLWLAQDRKYKGFHMIANLWEQFIADKPDAYLVIVGLHKEPEKKLPQSVFLGRIPNNKVHEVYQLADLFLFSSLIHEGHPLSLTEALQCGLTAIATDYPPNREILEGGKYGYLVPNPHFTDSWMEVLNLSYQNSCDNSHPFEAWPRHNFTLAAWQNRFEIALNSMIHEVS